MKILFLAANPDTTTPLHAGREVRRIRERLASAAYGGSIEIVERWAVRPGDLQPALLDVRPRIVHFSGHGNDERELMLEGDSGCPQPVGQRVLGELFRLRGDGVRLVVLSACHSLLQAETIAEHVDCAIGMRHRIGSEAAAELSAALYHAIASGDSIGRAFDSARLHLEAIGIPEHRTPQLVVRRSDVDPARIVFAGPARPAREPPPAAAAPSKSKADRVGSFPQLCDQCGSIVEPLTSTCHLCGHRDDGPSRVTEAHAEDPVIGTTLPNGYVILKRVDTGLLCRVYKAEHQLLRSAAAVKIVHRHLLDNEAARVRFMAEAKAGSRVRHPNLVNVIDVGTSGEILYMVMEWVHGRSLADMMREEGLLPFGRVVSIVTQVLLALEALHGAGLVHHNFHPEGIMVEERIGKGDSVKVLDIGLLKIVGAAGEPGHGFEYTSPEQLLGSPRDNRSDLYTCGVLLFQLLTGRLPFQALSRMEITLMHVTEPPPDPARIAPERGIPRGLVDITLKALAKAPRERFKTAGEFVDALLGLMPR